VARDLLQPAALVLTTRSLARSARVNWGNQRMGISSLTLEMVVVDGSRLGVR
jgi:hypothetical protein